MEEKNIWIREKEPSPVSEHLAVSIHSIGARWEKYDCGQLSGKPCNLLMDHISDFCANFFHSDVSGWGKVKDTLP